MNDILQYISFILVMKKRKLLFNLIFDFLRDGSYFSFLSAFSSDLFSMTFNILLISHSRDSFDIRNNLIFIQPNRQLVDKILPKDLVVYYLTGEKRILGTFEIVKEIFPEEKGFDSNWKPNHRQFMIKERIVRADNPLEINRKLRGQLYYFGGSRRNWGRLVQNTVNRIRYLQDFELIEDMLEKI